MGAKAMTNALLGEGLLGDLFGDGDTAREISAEAFLSRMLAFDYARTRPRT